LTVTLCPPDVTVIVRSTRAIRPVEPDVQAVPSHFVYVNPNDETFLAMTVPERVICWDAYVNDTV
jgi:hypothetical protein